MRCDPVHRPEPGPDVRAEAEQPRDIIENKMGSEQRFRGHLASDQQFVHAASNTAVRTPIRLSRKFRPKLAESCAKSGPITTPRFGEGGGPHARNCVTQALAASGAS